MAKNDVRNIIKLTSVDDLFTTEESRAEQQREKVMDIPLSECDCQENCEPLAGKMLSH